MCAKLSYGKSLLIQREPLFRCVRTVFLAAVASFMATGCDFTTGKLETALCSNGITVTNPAENVGLVEDCATLLGFRDKLAGKADLNWSPQRPIEDWEGVGLDSESTPLRVTDIRLDGRGLTGEVPPSLGIAFQT